MTFLQSLWGGMACVPAVDPIESGTFKFVRFNIVPALYQSVAKRYRDAPDDGMLTTETRPLLHQGRG